MFGCFKIRSAHSRWAKELALELASLDLAVDPNIRLLVNILLNPLANKARNWFPALPVLVEVVFMKPWRNLCRAMKLGFVCWARCHVFTSHVTLRNSGHNEHEKSVVWDYVPEKAAGSFWRVAWLNCSKRSLGFFLKLTNPVCCMPYAACPDKKLFSASNASLSSSKTAVSIYKSYKYIL